MCCPRRYVLFVLMTLLLVVVFMMRVSFTLAVVAMVNVTNQFNESDECPAGETDNSSVPITDGEFYWSPKMQSLLLSSFYYGYIVTQIPGGLIADRCGAKWVIFTSVFFPGVLYILMPTLARFNVYALIASQVLSGLCSGALYPAMHTMWMRWAPKKERTFLIGTSMNGSDVGQLVASGISGFLSDSSFLGGWPSIFYIFGGLQLLFCVFWVIFAHNSPATDPHISTKERLYIESGTAHLENAKYKSPPYMSIVKSPPVWAAVIIFITDHFWLYVIFSTLPIYMQRILRFSNTEIGLISMMPLGLSFVGTCLSSLIADILRTKGILSTSGTRRLNTFIGSVLMACLFALIPIAGCNKVAVISIIIITRSLNGANDAGYSINGTDIAPQFAGALEGLYNTAGSISGFISPFVVEALSGLSTSLRGWANVFYVTSAVTGFGGLVFIMFGSGEVQEWAKLEDDHDEEYVDKANGPTSATREHLLLDKIPPNESVSLK